MFDLTDKLSFKVPIKVSNYVEPADKGELVDCIRKLAKNSEKWVLIGNGSNVLFSHASYDGTVISTRKMLAQESFTKLIKGNKISVSSGNSLSDFSYEMSKLEFKGFESLSGIPGTIGGGIYMNAGAYGGEIKDVLCSVEVYDVLKDETCCLDVSELKLAYRESLFKKEKGRFVILEGQFRLEKGENIFLTANDNLKKRREKQPLDKPSAGSFFKRPKGNFAGTLIENAGLKGKQMGGAMVSEKHAGFIVNNGNAKIEDIISLKDFVIKTVLEKFGIELEPEVEFVE